eukprot:Phypoly_transcript_06578.p1 GENE.Phypoly_transcript_06578~~Phypoly_transcript_06578.p1  ORF type:complete len:571 (+),score=78.44 Phypoly_transcript_06578:161-1714(+)
MTKDIRKACNNCIKAKAACDHNRPCLRCVSHKIADTCANVQRKANKRRVMEDSHSSCPCQSSTTNISCMLNTSLNNIINNLNNTNNNGNTYLTQHAHAGEVTGSNIINTAVQNLYSSNTSQIISNTLSSLSDSSDTQMDYESALNWLQNAVSVPTYTTPSSPAVTYPHSFPPLDGNKTTSSIATTYENNKNNNDNFNNTSNKFSPPLVNSSPSQPTSTPSPSQPTSAPSPSQPNASPSLPCTSTPSSQFNIGSPGSSASPSSPSVSVIQAPLKAPLALPEAPHQDLPPLPTLNITIYTKTNPNAPTHTYISDLLKLSPQGVEDPTALNPTVYPHNISIPNCSAESLVQTISLLSKYAAIDFHSPVHIDYKYKSVPFTLPPVGLVETSNHPTLIDCNELFAQFCGFPNVEEATRQARPISEIVLPEGLLWAKRSIELLVKYNMPYIERYHVFLLKDRPPRVFLTQHKLVGCHHRTITFLEEYPDFPLCFFVDWIKKILPNAVLPPCPRPYCHCKYPDE